MRRVRRAKRTNAVGVVKPAEMRTLCDVCEAGPARLFCAADEAALCTECDEKVRNSSFFMHNTDIWMLAEEGTAKDLVGFDAE